MRRRTLAGEDGHLDLVPLIDCVFLVLLFFMVCGHLSSDQRPEQISVPPARTANERPAGPERVLVNIRSDGGPKLRFGTSGPWIPLADGSGWQAVRDTLDRVWDRAGKRVEGGATVADAILEIRADGNADWRVVQEFQLIAADGIDPDTFLPRRSLGRSFIHLDFTTRPVSGS